ncbi:MAG: proton-conducting membrane transporter, partial [Firmicutes bacterium]|nr:proton-conducting membrane transporter [Bacillota bacterium]
MTNVYTLLNITDKLSLQFGTDAVGRFFLCLVSVMWVLVGIYAQKYKEHQKHNARFFVFYALTWVMLAALTMAANYLTMYLCFEFMTLLSMPLVLHNGTPESIAAAKKYLFYSIFGATLGLLGMFFVNSYGTTLAFATGGVLDPAKIAGHETLILWVAFLSV